jgi:hypothetical protein
MRRFGLTLVALGGLLSPVAVYAQAVPGFEVQYDAVLVACGPEGSAEACAVALDALIAAYAAIDPLTGAPFVPEATALASITSLRTELVELNSGNPEELALIDGVFELALPESGDIGGGGASVLGGGGLGTGGGGGTGVTNTTPTDSVEEGPVSPSPTV